MKRFYTLLISILFCYLTLMSQAQTPIDSLQKVLKNANTDNDRLSVLEKIYNYYRPIDMDSAQITVNRALTLARKTNNAKAETSFLIKLGIVLRANKSDYKTALETYLKALKIAESNADTAVWSEIYYGIGRIEADGGHNKEAEEAFEAGIRWARTDIRRYNSIEALAVLFANQKKLEQAEKMFLTLIPLVKQSKELYNYPLRMYDNIGEFYKTYKNDKVKSLYYYQQGAKYGPTDPKIDFTRYLVECMTLCSVFFSLEDYENAKLYALKITPYHSNPKDNIKEVAAKSYKILFQISRIQGNYSQAVLYADSAIMLRDSIFALVNSDSLKRETYKLNAAFKLERTQKEVELLAQKQKTQLAWTLAASLVALLLLALALVIQRNKKKVEQQRQELTALNATKDRLFAILSHDLMSPIATLKNYMSLMDWGVMSHEQFAQSSERLKIKVNNLYNLLENVLHWSISQMQGIKPKIETVNINEVVNEQIALLSTIAATKGITLTQAIKSDATIQADKNHLALIVRNLLQNALKFTSKGGKIHFSSDDTEGGQKLMIQDTGIGMSNETLSKLFNIEQNVNREGTAQEGGTGLGLILTKDLVELNGGTINVSSELGKGTTFSMVF